jgi:hypothetical protein
MEKKSGLVKKLIEILKEVGPIEKAERNAHFGYNYTGEGQVLAALRGRLAERNILLITSVSTCVPEYGEGGHGVYVCVTTRHKFMDGETGEELELQGAGLGWDSGDKGVYKAITGAVKYVLMKNFLITDGQDPESGEQRKPAAEPGQAPAGAPHRRTRDYENETGKGDKKVETDFAALDAFLLENNIPQGFVILRLKEKGLIDARATKLDNIKPGILKRCIQPAAKATLLKAWADQQKDDEGQSGTETKVAPREKKEVRTNEGDQTRAGTRRQPCAGQDPKAVVEEAGHKNWRTVKIHWGRDKGTPLGKVSKKSLTGYWISQWHPELYRNKWNKDDVLLDSAICLASEEIGGE